MEKMAERSPEEAAAEKGREIGERFAQELKNLTALSAEAAASMSSGVWQRDTATLDAIREGCSKDDIAKLEEFLKKLKVGWP